MKTYPFNATVQNIHRLRINLKSLISEVRHIKHEMRRCGPEYRSILQSHLQCVVKPELRITNLALAFVRGQAYRVVENRCKVPVDRKRLMSKLVKFYSIFDPMYFNNWLEQKT